MDMTVPPRFPLRIFYDGACPVCSREIEHYCRRDHDGRLIAIDISAPDFDPPPCGIPRESLMYELHAIDRDGIVYRGVDAFCAIWQAFPASITYRLLGTFVNLPGISTLARLGYRGFARLRPRLPGRKENCAAGTCRIGGDIHPH
jgi:predicted DCC family thiol-disulfide oxidoreductase YuxK